jgi:hypothetical protein
MPLGPTGQAPFDSDSNHRDDSDRPFFRGNPPTRARFPPSEATTTYQFPWRHVDRDRSNHEKSVPDKAGTLAPPHSSTSAPKVVIGSSVLGSSVLGSIARRHGARYYAPTPRAHGDRRDRGSLATRQRRLRRACAMGSRHTPSGVPASRPSSARARRA